MASSRVAALLAACALTLLSCSASRKAALAQSEDVTLRELDGRAVSLRALLGQHDATVLVFWSASCPCVRRYQARVEELERTYAGRGIGFLAIDSNADDGAEAIARVRDERKVSTRLLRDEGALLADIYGAKTTPTVALVRADGELLFRGWVDNERQPGESGRVAYLADALDGYLSHRAFADRSPYFGCLITRSLAQSSTGEPTCSQPQTPCSCSSQGTQP